MTTRFSAVQRLLRLATVAVGVAITVASTSPHAALVGDVDGDGQVTVRDAIRLLKVVNRKTATFSRDRLLGHSSRSVHPDEYLTASPTPGDLPLTLDDVAAVLRVATGLEPPTEVGPVVYNFIGFGDVARHQDETGPDGYSESVHLNTPYDLAVGSRGEVYFTENYGGRIRVREPDGRIRTLAGQNATGLIDGPGNAALFYWPEGIAILPDGDLVVADTYNHVIRRVQVPNGTVTTIAGSGQRGHDDGVGKAATFAEPNGVCVDPGGNIYVADTMNSLIRKITPDGRVTTIAGTGKPGLSDGAALESQLYTPSGVLFDPRDAGLFIADMGSNTIRKLTRDGALVTLAGSRTAGMKDGVGRSARFHSPYGMDLDSLGRLWIADWGNIAVRVMYPNGRVVTISGKRPEGNINGPASNAHYNGLMNVRVGPYGVLYLADTDNQRIRALAP